MTRRQKGLTIFISIVLAIVIAITAGIVLIVRKVNSNPLIGTWNEVTGAGQLEFYEDGSAEITYENETIPVLNISYTGKLDGTYAYDKSRKEMSLTVNIYSKEITSAYTFEVKKNTLTLTDKQTGKERMYNLYIAPKE